MGKCWQNTQGGHANEGNLNLYHVGDLQIFQQDSRTHGVDAESQEAPK